MCSLCKVKLWLKFKLGFGFKTFSPKREMLLKEYGWYGMACPYCKEGLLPEPDDPENDTTSECIDCRKQTNVRSLLEVSLYCHHAFVVFYRCIFVYFTYFYL